MEYVGTQPYQVKRDTHPAITIYWIAESVERGRPVMLYELSCLFCKRTIASDFRGEIAMIVNAPANTIDIDLAITILCKQCKQQYRLVYSDSFLG